MKFVLYSLAVMSNMAVIFLLPEDQTTSFLGMYSIASMVLGVLLIFALSSDDWLIKVFDNLRALLILLFFLTLIGFYKNSIPLAAFAYAGSLLLADYLITQSCSALVVNVYRALLAGTAVPLVLGLDDYNYFIIYARILYCISFLLIFIKHDGGFKRLAIDNPMVYILGTHLFYFGSLAIIPWIVAIELVKIWYIGSQIGFGVLLKISDYQIRSKNEHKYLNHPLLQLVVLLYGLFIFIVFGGVGGVLLYMIGYIGLVFTFKFARRV